MTFASKPRQKERVTGYQNRANARSGFNRFSDTNQIESRFRTLLAMIHCGACAGAVVSGGNRSKLMNCQGLPINLLQHRVIEKAEQQQHPTGKHYDV